MSKPKTSETPTDRQRIEQAMELIENVPGKSVSGARSLLKSALKKL